MEEQFDLRRRTQLYGISVVRLYVQIPKSAEGQVMGRQMLRSGTSVGAQYREACRARSNAEFISKMESALQELDETAYWLEIMAESKVHRSTDGNALLAETDELIRIFITIVKKKKGV